MEAQDPLANRLACYAPQLAGTDDMWGLRLLLHDFGLVWQNAPDSERVGLLADEPPLCGVPHWDAFLASYAGRLAITAASLRLRGCSRRLAPPVAPAAGGSVRDGDQS